MAEVLNASAYNLDRRHDRSSDKKPSTADDDNDAIANSPPLPPPPPLGRDRDSRECRDDRDFDRPPRGDFYNRNRSPPPRERDCHKRGRPSPSAPPPPPPPPYRDRRVGGGPHSPPSPPYKRWRDNGFDGRRGSPRGGYSGPGDLSRQPVEEQIEEEEECVLLDLDNVSEQISITPDAPYVLSGLDTPNPILTIDGTIKLIGEYEETVGTCIVFKEGELDPAVHEETDPSEANLFMGRGIVDASRTPTKRVDPIASLHRVLRFRVFVEGEDRIEK